MDSRAWPQVHRYTRGGFYRAFGFSQRSQNPDCSAISIFLIQFPSLLHDGGGNIINCPPKGLLSEPWCARWMPCFHRGTTNIRIFASLITEKLLEYKNKEGVFIGIIRSSNVQAVVATCSETVLGGYKITIR